MAWFNSARLAGMIKTQQELYVELTEYQELLSDLDEVTRAIMLAPDRAELRRRKVDTVEALQHQLGFLAEKAPIVGPVRKTLIGLATHFRKKLIPEADQVQKHAAAPGPFAMDRFRNEYAEVRLQHAERVGELLEMTRNLAGDAVSSAQHRLLLSAGLFLLLWSGSMAWLVGKARLRPESFASDLADAAPSSADSHAHGVSHSHPHPTEEPAAPVGNQHQSHTPEEASAAVSTAATASDPATVSATVSDPTDPTIPPRRESEPLAEPITPPESPVHTSATAPGVAAGAPQAVAATAAASSSAGAPPVDASGGEMSQNQIAELLTASPAAQAAATVAAPAPASGPAPAVHPAPTPAPAGGASAPISGGASATSPAAASAPSVLPPGPVDLASLMGEAAEEVATPAPSTSPAAPVASSGPAPLVGSTDVSASTSTPSPTPAPAVPSTPVAAPSTPPAAAAASPAPPAVAVSAPVVAAVPAPLPDVQTLMKGASAMTTEQLTAMLFGVGPSAGAAAPAASAKPASPAAAAPAVPPRTITGAEMATAKPGDDKPPVVDLSF